MRWPLLCVVVSLACQSVDWHEPAALPVFEVSGDRAQLGFDAPFSIVVHVPALVRAPIDVRWRQIDGPAVRDIAVTDGGLRFSARTPRLTDCREGALPWAMVPLSPRTRGQVVVEAEWRRANDERTHRQRITVSAAARSGGLPNVPVDQRLYLGGAGWRLMEAPLEAHATIEERDGIGTLRPDARGIWQLIDGDGRTLRIQAGRYVETPLDCGRAGCHGERVHAAQSSPMTWALARRIDERTRRTATRSAGPSAPDDLSCTMACHATGEEGIHDGGFFDIASDLHVSTSLASMPSIAALPRAMRRLGSVGCLACHGPSALPEAEARWSILRSDVCAQCHDAPPRYGHVLAWQTTRMARADQDPAARSERACTPCHTTWGHLRDIDLHATRDEAPTRVPPAGVGAIGISCPACHAVHDPSLPAEPERSLLRTPHLGPMFEGVPREALARSGTCIPCHAPRDSARLAQASAAAIWAGRGGVDPETGAPLIGAAPHLAVEGGCVGCHRAGPDGIEHGTNHGFRADRRQCTSCHADAARDAGWADERARIEKDARSLWDSLLARGPLARAQREPAEPSRPPHATITLRRDADSARARAAYDLSLLLEDRGFLAHNLPYARMLLERVRPWVR
ncbi:MAG TPA: hypothetical protein VK550_15965 [Polyangiaceae bacterium]|nr:hypothetical protein [Polyangiaceae bacterium]